MRQGGTTTSPYLTYTFSKKCSYRGSQRSILAELPEGTGPNLQNDCLLVSSSVLSEFPRSRFRLLSTGLLSDNRNDAAQRQLSFKRPGPRSFSLDHRVHSGDLHYFRAVELLPVPVIEYTIVVAFPFQRGYLSDWYFTILRSRETSLVLRTCYPMLGLLLIWQVQASPWPVMGLMTMTSCAKKTEILLVSHKGKKNFSHYI